MNNQFFATWPVKTVITLPAILSILLLNLDNAPAQDGDVAGIQVTISLIRQSDVPARDSGTVQAIKCAEGMTVRKGDVLIELESEQQTLHRQAAELALEIAKMRANDHLPLQTAEAQLKEAEAGREVTEVALKIAEAEAGSASMVGIATAETRLRELELERARSSKKSFDGSVSKSQIDRLQTSVDKGKLEIQHAQDALEVQKLKTQTEIATLGQKQQQIARYASLLDQEKNNKLIAVITERLRANELRLAEASLEHRLIRTPFDGVVVKLEKQLGEWVEPGTPVARVIDVKHLRAEGFLPAAHADPSLVGHNVTILIESGGRSFDVVGKIAFVSLEVDPQNQQSRFYADFDNSDLRTRPGMTGSMTIRK